MSRHASISGATYKALTTDFCVDWVWRCFQSLVECWLSDPDGRVPAAERRGRQPWSGPITKTLKNDSSCPQLDRGRATAASLLERVLFGQVLLRSLPILERNGTNIASGSVLLLPGNGFNALELRQNAADEFIDGIQVSLLMTCDAACLLMAVYGTRKNPSRLHTSAFGIDP